MSIDFVLDSLFANILPRIKNVNTVKLLMDSMKNARESLTVIDLINCYKDLEQVPSGYLYSSDPLYCSSYVNTSDDDIQTRVVNHQNDIFVYMLKSVDGFHIYTKNPFIFIGTIDGDNFSVSSSIEEDMEGMSLSRTFRYYIRNIISEYKSGNR